ncbi:MAG: hypothetical protein ACE5MI_11275 [Acidimicrobiia bacterium]
MDRFTAEGDPEGVAFSLLFLGNVTDDPAEGIAMQESALLTFRKRGRTIATYAARIFKSVNLVRAGDLEAALELRQKLVAEAIATPILPELTAWTHWTLALLLFNLDRLEEAVDHNRYVLDVAIEIRSQEMIASSGDLVAVAEAAQGRLEEATLIHGACQQIWDRLGVAIWWEAAMLIEAAMAKARQQLGDAEHERLLAQGAAMSLDELIEFLGV